MQGSQSLISQRTATRHVPPPLVLGRQQYRRNGGHVDGATLIQKNSLGKYTMLHDRISTQRAFGINSAPKFIPTS